MLSESQNASFSNKFDPTDYTEKIENNRSRALIQLPFPLIMIAIYIWVIINGKRHYFQHFLPFHLLMYCSFPFPSISFTNLSSWNDLMSFGFTTLLVFELYFVPDLIFSFTLTNVLFLFTNARERWMFLGYFWKRWMFYVPVIIATSVIKRIIIFTFSSVSASSEIISIICEALLVLIVLLIWFIWWLGFRKQEPLSLIKVCYLISAIFYVPVALIVTTIPILIEHLTGFKLLNYMEPFYYLPFIWVLSAVISAQPEVQRVFQRKKVEEPEGFQLSYISV